MNSETPGAPRRLLIKPADTPSLIVWLSNEMGSIPISAVVVESFCFSFSLARLANCSINKILIQQIPISEKPNAQREVLARGRENISILYWQKILAQANVD
jgi:hypothetical protein